MAARVKELRRRQGWTAEQLAERCAEIGAPEVTAWAVGGIERRRRGRAVTVDELLALAYALSVPPVLLLVPLGTEDQVTIVPSVTVHPDLALKWIQGDEPPITSERKVTGDLSFWRQESQPIRLYQRLHAAQDAAAEADAEVRRAEHMTAHGVGGQGDRVQQAQQARLDALRKLAEALDDMAELSVRAPALPRDLVEPMLTFELLKHPDAVRTLEPQDHDRG